MKIVYFMRELSIERLKGRNANMTLCNVMKCVVTKLEVFITLLDDYMISNSDVMADERSHVLKFVTPKIRKLVNLLRDER